MDAAKEYLDTDFAHLTLSDGTKVGDHPAFIKAFAKIASDVGEDKFVSGNGPQYMTPDEISKQVGELQKQDQHTGIKTTRTMKQPLKRFKIYLSLNTKGNSKFE